MAGRRRGGKRRSARPPPLRLQRQPRRPSGGRPRQGTRPRAPRRPSPARLRVPPRGSSHVCRQGIRTELGLQQHDRRSTKELRGQRYRNAGCRPARYRRRHPFHEGASGDHDSQRGQHGEQETEAGGQDRLCQQQADDGNAQQAEAAPCRPNATEARPMLPMSEARSTLGSGPTMRTNSPSPARLATAAAARERRNVRAVSSSVPMTRLQFAPLTAVRCVIPTVFMAASRSRFRALVSPVTIPGSSPAASPPNPGGGSGETTTQPDGTLLPGRRRCAAPPAEHEAARMPASDAPGAGAEAFRWCAVAGPEQRFPTQFRPSPRVRHVTAHRAAAEGQDL